MISAGRTSHGTLQWTSQLHVLPQASTPALRGDRMVLPPSALEQLLSAATAVKPAIATAHTSDVDLENPLTFSAERNPRAQLVERHQDLPHPLTFRLVNPENGTVVYAGIREFSAEEGHVGLSPFLSQSLGFEGKSEVTLNNGGKSAKITVHVRELEKGNFVKLRPLEAGYDPQDWKALLERSLRDNFTTLTRGEILTVTSGPDTFRFLVDELKPNEEAVTIVDTDLEVDIEALNVEQATETLKRRLEKNTVVSDAAGGNSADKVVETGKLISGQVVANGFVNYTLDEYDRRRDVEIEVTATNDRSDVDLFVSPAGPRQQARPTYNEHVFAELSSRSTKRIKIARTNPAMDGAEALWISVSSYGTTDQPEPQAYHLRVSAVDDEKDGKIVQVDESSHSDETLCKNCKQWIPQRTIFLHENFCYRNNILCPQCFDVFQKSSSEWQKHWHCPHDSFYGIDDASHTKHDALFHTPQICKSCGYHTKNIPDLAQHRTTLCPEKQILCSFCHLVVPQQGPDDPDILDPEVILSGFTPHEVSDGGRTTECHLCDKIIRLRDMSVHLKHHNFARLSRIKPRICRNINCGRLLDTLSKTGEVRQTQQKNTLDVCDTCFGPLYVSNYDPDGKALKRRVERRYLQQLLTGCGQPWCANRFCKSGRQHQDAAAPPVLSKEAMTMIKPFMDEIWNERFPLHFCTDEASQTRRNVAGMIAAEGTDGPAASKGKGKEGMESGYELEWCAAALGVENNDLDKARLWLGNFAPRRGEGR